MAEDDAKSLESTRSRNNLNCSENKADDFARAGSTREFRYKPLDEQLRGIRLLSLPKESDVSKDIICNLCTVYLDDENLQYIALSYAWGEEHASNIISLNGRDFHVGDNLYSALRSIRLHHEMFPDASEILMWVDAICIDQSNIQERNHQVSLMWSIYERAELVTVWLGEPDDDSIKAFAFLQELEGRIKSAGGYETFLKDYETVAKKTLFFKDSPDYMGWQALKALLGRSWFQRVWIIQEVSAARDIAVACGNVWIAWDFLGVAMFVLSTNWHWFTSSERFTKLRSLVYLGFGQKYGTKFTPLEHLLVYGRGSKATDPRDKVFALLGMASDVLGVPNPHNGLPTKRYTADYNKQVSRVYSEAVEVAISNSCRLDILSSCCSCSHAGLPSWAPDWTCNEFTSEIMVPDSPRPESESAILRTDNYSRAAGLSISIAIFSPDLSTLTVKGVSVGIITSVFAYAEDTQSTISAWAVEMQSRNTLWYVTGEIGSEAFRRMLVMNRGDILTAAIPKDYWIAYLLFLDHITVADACKLAYGEEHTLEQIRELEQTCFNFASWTSTVIRDRCFFTCDTDHIGLGPPNTEAGDVLSVMLGAKDPFILRKQQDHYLMLGKCYAHGLQDGEAMEHLEEGKYSLEDFVLR